MALLLLKLDKLFVLPIPFLFILRHGSRKALLKAKLGGWFVSVATRKKKVTDEWKKLARDLKLLQCNSHLYGVFFEIFPRADKG
jgi:hypothetical protein